jgi:hypothetical protein
MKWCHPIISSPITISTLSQIFKSRKPIIHAIRQDKRPSQNHSATSGSLKGLFPCYLPLLAFPYALHSTCTTSYNKSCTTPCYITSYHKLSSYPPTLPITTLIIHNYVIDPICPHGYSIYNARPCKWRHHNPWQILAQWQSFLSQTTWTIRHFLLLLPQIL